jgi:hypothetical protein
MLQRGGAREDLEKLGKARSPQLHLTTKPVGQLAALEQQKRNIKYRELQHVIIGNIILYHCLNDLDGPNVTVFSSQSHIQVFRSM